MTNQITLTNDAILHLVTRADVLAAVPSLNALASKAKARRKGCRCSSSAAKASDQIAQEIKRTIRAADPAAKEALKRVLGATTVKWYVDKTLVEI